MDERSTILIADDDDGVRDILKLLLETEYHLVLATTGTDALEKARATMPDLILLDVMLPDLDGFSVCRKLRADSVLAEVPIVLITALHDEKSLLEGIKAGADDFISKPFDLAEISARARTITRLNRYRRLHTERLKFGWVTAQSDEGYLIVDDADNILEANPRARLFLDLPTDTPLPPETNFLTVVKKQYQFHPIAVWETWPQWSEGVTHYLVRPETSATNPFWLQVDVLDLARGPDIGRVVRLRDVSKEMNTRRDMRGFHNMVRHKLAAPLLGILGSLELLSSQTSEMSKEEMTKLVEVSLDSAKRLHQQVDDIFQYLAPNLNHPDASFSLAKLPDVVAELSDVVTISSVTTNLPEPLAALSIGLSQQAVELMLWELFENAKKFHPDHAPHVEVLVTNPQAGYLRLCIQDNGINLSPDQLLRAWEPYYQGEKFFTGEAVGMGLGLSLVASLILGVGGTCQIHNRANGPGVAIELLIPIQREDKTNEPH